MDSVFAVAIKGLRVRNRAGTYACHAGDKCSPTFDVIKANRS